MLIFLPCSTTKPLKESRKALTRNTMRLNQKSKDSKGIIRASSTPTLQEAERMGFHPSKWGAFDEIGHFTHEWAYFRMLPDSEAWTPQAFAPHPIMNTIDRCCSIVTITSILSESPRYSYACRNIYTTSASNIWKFSHLSKAAFSGLNAWVLMS